MAVHSFKQGYILICTFFLNLQIDCYNRFNDMLNLGQGLTTGFNKCLCCIAYYTIKITLVAGSICRYPLKLIYVVYKFIKKILCNTWIDFTNFTMSCRLIVYYIATYIKYGLVKKFNYIKNAVIEKEPNAVLRFSYVLLQYIKNTLHYVFVVVLLPVYRIVLSVILLFLLVYAYTRYKRIQKRNEPIADPAIVVQDEINLAPGVVDSEIVPAINKLRFNLKPISEPYSRIYNVSVLVCCRFTKPNEEELQLIGLKRYAVIINNLNRAFIDTLHGRVLPLVLGRVLPLGQAIGEIQRIYDTITDNEGTHGILEDVVERRERTTIPTLTESTLQLVEYSVYKNAPDAKYPLIVYCMFTFLNYNSVFVFVLTVLTIPACNLSKKMIRFSVDELAKTLAEYPIVPSS